MPNASIIKAIRQLMPTWQATDITSIEYLSGGYSNTNYAFNHASCRYVLRIPQVHQPYVDRVQEAVIYEQLPAGIGIRAIAASVETGAMITPWVEGPLLADVGDKFSLATLAKYLQRLHTALPINNRHYDLERIDTEFWLPETPPFTAPETTHGNMITCHNDLNPWNIIVTEQGWVTLDWEFVGLNDPLFDVVTLHQGLELNTATLNELVALYFGTEDPSHSLRTSNALRSFWIRELGWAQFQLQAGNTREEIVVQKDKARSVLAKLDA